MERLKKELPRFLVAGSSAVATDMGVYYLLLNFLSHSPAKAISFLCGTVVAYVLNKYWTFGQDKRSTSEVMRFAALYLTTLSLNVLTNKLTLTVLPGFVFIAFLSATAVSTTLNFIGQKFWVFRVQEGANAQ